MIDSKGMTSNKALETARDAVLLVRSGTATKEQLEKAIVNLSVIVVLAVDTITELRAALMFKSAIDSLQTLDVEGHEVPDNGDVN